MKTVVGLLVGLGLGFVSGKFYFQPNSIVEAKHNTVTDASQALTTNQVNVEAVASTATQDSQVNDNPASIPVCPPPSQNASNLSTATRSYPEVEAPHPVFGDGDKAPDELKAAMTKEQPDDQWQFYLQPIVEEHLKNAPFADKLQSQNLDCRASACRIEATYQMSDAKELTKLHHALARAPFVSPRMSSISMCQPSNLCTVEFFLSRDPNNDPHMTAIPWSRLPKSAY